MSETDQTAKQNNSQKIGFNDRFKIAHAVLENPFSFPDFTKVQGFDEGDYLKLDGHMKSEANEYMDLVSRELKEAETKKIGLIKKRYYEDTARVSPPGMGRRSATSKRTYMSAQSVEICKILIVMHHN